jgi:hypothetical protein
MRSRSSIVPWPMPYCRLVVPSSDASRPIISPTASSGSAAMYGDPPARETTSGRLATANSARISDVVIPRTRRAYRSV